MILSATVPAVSSLNTPMVNKPCFGPRLTDTSSSGFSLIDTTVKGLTLDWSIIDLSVYDPLLLLL